MPEPTWRGRSHGGGLGTALITWVIRLGGRDLCYVILLGPSLWLWLRDRPARRASLDYWRRLGARHPGWASLRHFWTFARTLADRVIAVQHPAALRYDQSGMEHLAAGLAHPGGRILLSAHLGSFELAARWVGERTGARLHLVMFDSEDPAVQAQLHRAMGDRPYQVIDLNDAEGAGFAIASALGQGETCCMLGDRAAASQAGNIVVPFLGGQAAFPSGPFIAAAATGAVIVPTFCVRTGWATWRCEADQPFSVDLGPRPERQARLRDYVAAWAARLEARVRRHPYGWNNYYDFWA